MARKVVVLEDPAGVAVDHLHRLPHGGRAGGRTSLPRGEGGQLRAAGLIGQGGVEVFDAILGRQSFVLTAQPDGTTEFTDPEPLGPGQGRATFAGSAGRTIPTPLSSASTCSVTSLFETD